MKFLDPEIVPPEEEFVLFDWDTLLWVGVAWLFCVGLVALAWLLDRMTEDVLKIFPKDESRDSHR